MAKKDTSQPAAQNMSLPPINDGAGAYYSGLPSETLKAEAPHPYIRPRVIPPILQYRVLTEAGSELFVDAKVAAYYQAKKNRMGNKSPIHSITEFVR